MSEKSISVLVVGATGQLGRLIALECLKRPNLKVSILVEDIDKDKDLVSRVKERGGQVFQADVTNPESVRGVTKGIHTVISALGGNNKVMIEGQRYLLEDAIFNSCERFVPSDYTFDIWSFKPGIHYFLDQRLKFRQILKKAPIRSLHVSCGMFIETFLYLNKDKFSYWGDLNRTIDLTAMEDVAKYLAAAVSNPDRDGDLKITGNERTLRDYIDTWEAVNKTNAHVVNEGTVDDLFLRVAELKDSGNTLEYIKLGYLIHVFSGTGKILYNDNGEFPEIQPISFEEFLIKNKGKQAIDYSIPESVTKAKEEIQSY